MSKIEAENDRAFSHKENTMMKINYFPHRQSRKMISDFFSERRRYKGTQQGSILSRFSFKASQSEIRASHCASQGFLKLRTWFEF